MTVVEINCNIYKIAVILLFLDWEKFFSSCQELLSKRDSTRKYGEIPL